MIAEIERLNDFIVACVEHDGKYLSEIERLNALIAELNAAWDVDKEMLEKYRNAKIVGWASPMFSILMPVTKTTVFGSHTIAVYSHEEIE